MLTEILRNEWGFNGYVVADYHAIQELYTRHKITRDKREAAIKAISAGVDIELPDMDSYPEIKHLVESGELSMNVLDTTVRRLLRPKFLMGLFEDPYVDPEKAETIVCSKENAQLAGVDDPGRNWQFNLLGIFFFSPVPCRHRFVLQ